DLPTPGSPAIRTTEPGIMPSPKTRSSSPIPVFKALVVLATLDIGCAGDEGVRPLDTCPVIAAAATFALAVAGIDSCRVPQDPHSGQRPSHLGETYPHSEQVWMGRCFLAMSSYSSRPARHCISPGS